jgi:hypothetical protein
MIESNFCKTNEQIESEVERVLIKCFDSFSEEFWKRPEILEKLKEFDVVISEDNGGRLPAEIFRAIINKLKDEDSLPSIPIVGVQNSRITTADDLRGQLEQLDRSGAIGKQNLYVTEKIDMGGTTERAMQEIWKLYNDRENPPQFYLATLDTGSFFQNFRRNTLNPFHAFAYYHGQNLDVVSDGIRRCSNDQQLINRISDHVIAVIRENRNSGNILPKSEGLLWKDDRY